MLVHFLDIFERFKVAKENFFFLVIPINQYMRPAQIRLIVDKSLFGKPDKLALNL